MNTFKMRIKKGDVVKVLTGKDKSKTGKVLEIFPKTGRLSVEGLNIRVRFSKPKKRGEKGQRLELPASMNVSKVMLVCSHCGKATRIGHEKTPQGNARKCKHCAKLI